MTTARHEFHPADQRSSAILQSVRSAFAEKGFDGASMQDLARAAGMSAANFYRYFPSKAAIVDALISHDLMVIQQDFGQIITAPHPVQALRSLLGRRIPEHQSCEDGALWAEITAAAQRKPDIWASAGRMESQIRDYMLGVFVAETGWPREKVAEVFSAHAAFIIVLFKSASMAATMPAEIRGAMTDMILATIDRTLGEVSSARLKA
ncbi:TetR/AcrR family transcriptional regulator [Fuscibacter oryzae]|uniref:TetR/AcrR family transcriptional regulator n=1 Tax=Fuscibacter oryzae TaxID=2803939 RepID=A0A8J7MRP6_9RHOB|nr:TetR/AcrR family transcriptional regulator [Fuscibacter oryzae]MBL4927569.1 TetR/AcrR family transcriptional regulator [Fuscibacter oryzae]